MAIQACLRLEVHRDQLVRGHRRHRPLGYPAISGSTSVLPELNCVSPILILTFPTANRVRVRAVSSLRLNRLGGMMIFKVSQRHTAA